MKLIKNKRHRDPRYFLNETMLGGGEMLPDDPRQLIKDACSEFGQEMVRTLAHQIIDDPRSIISLIEASPAGPKLKEMGISIQDIVAKSVGTSNPHNMVRATFEALKSASSPKIIAVRRSLKINEITKRRKISQSNDENAKN